MKTQATFFNFSPESAKPPAAGPRMPEVRAKLLGQGIWEVATSSPNPGTEKQLRGCEGKGLSFQAK